MGVGVGAGEVDAARKGRHGVAISILGGDVKRERGAGHGRGGRRCNRELGEGASSDIDGSARPRDAASRGRDGLASRVGQRGAEVACAVRQAAAGRQLGLRVRVGTAEAHSASKARDGIAVEVLGLHGERKWAAGHGGVGRAGEEEVIERRGRDADVRAGPRDGTGCGRDRLDAGAGQRRIECTRSRRQGAAGGELRVGIGVGAAEADGPSKAADRVAVDVLGGDHEAEGRAGDCRRGCASDSEMVEDVGADENARAGAADQAGESRNRLRAGLRQRRGMNEPVPAVKELLPGNTVWALVSVLLKAIGPVKVVRVLL